MTEAFIQLAVAAVVIILAGTLLTRFAESIAEETSLGGLLVGSLFLASATSLPEITVDFNAIAMNQPNLAIGDLLGSSLFNLLILMIVSACFHFSEAPSSRAHHHAMAATLSIALTVLAALGIIANLDVQFLHAGLFPWMIMIGYLGGLQLLFRIQKEPEIESGGKNKDKKRLAMAICGYIGCASILLLAAPYLTEAADVLATASGLGHSFIGATLLALSTSLPELVATIAAYRMRCPDLALGNVFGSNMFNMVMFLPLDFYYTGNLLQAGNDINAVTALGVIFTTSIATLALLTTPATRKGVLTGNALVAASTIATLWLLYSLQIG